MSTGIESTTGPLGGENASVKARLIKRGISPALRASADHLQTDLLTAKASKHRAGSSLRIWVLSWSQMTIIGT
jgi:hypothetical protein